MDNQASVNQKSILGGAALIATSILVAAFIVSTRSTPAGAAVPGDSTQVVLPGSERPLPTESSIGEQFVAQLKAETADKTFTVKNAKRTLRDIAVTDVRFSHKKDSLLVSYNLTWEPPAATSDDIILSDDNFGRYVGYCRATWETNGNSQSETAITGVPLTPITIK